MPKKDTPYFVFSVCYMHKNERKLQRDIEKQGHGKRWSLSAKLYAPCEHEARRALIYNILDNGWWVVTVERAEDGVA
jgi:hypothetical protein